MRPLDAALLAAWLRDFAAAVTDGEPHLTELDRLIGDTDHGINLQRGLRSVAAIDPGDCASARDYAKRAAMAVVSGVGGASGALYGTFLLRLAAALPPDGPITAAQWSVALHAGLTGLVERGKAELGDKTMVDALAPALDAFDAAAAEPFAAEPFAAAAAAAAAGRDATVDLVARKGRASYLGDRSRGVADPGATSVAWLMASAAATLG